MTEKRAREDTHRGANGAEGHGGLQLSTSGSLDPTLSHYAHSGAVDDTRMDGLVPAQGVPSGRHAGGSVRRHWNVRQGSVVVLVGGWLEPRMPRVGRTVPVFAMVATATQQNMNSSPRFANVVVGLVATESNAGTQRSF